MVLLLRYLIDVRLPRKLINLIMMCVSSCSRQVMWEWRTPTNGFMPVRGLCQGDLLSPYLFVLCVERLEQIINLVINQNLWKPIILSRDGSKLSHLFFVGNLALSAGFY